MGVIVLAAVLQSIIFHIYSIITIIMINIITINKDNDNCNNS